ncbi:MAG: hypothetical protein QNJ47_28145 [Nostocaceae cyanobacterium]|nr:hypothetical protein [Nostocaceae cyanobacterium]
MALPDNFNETEHLMDLFKREYNKQIQKYFKNQPDDDVSTPKASLKHACRVKDSDSILRALLRAFLFEITVGYAQSVQAPIYGTPVQELQRVTKFKPQIKLYFKEPYSYEKHNDGTEQVRGEISFRIMNKDSDTISRADAEQYARAIKNEFGNPIYTWRKGKFKCTYLDLDNGYDLRILCISKQEGQRVIKSILKILNTTYNDDNFQFIENTKEYPTKPGTHRVYGRTVRKFRQRPTADLKFTHAQLLISGRIKAVNLVSVNRRLRNAIQYIGVE